MDGSRCVSHNSTPHHRNGPFTRTDLEVRTWGLAVYDASDAEAQHCLFEICRPVLVDSTDQRFLGATKQTNNTAELTAIAEALIWLDTEAPGRRHKIATICYDCYDSQHAADVTQGMIEISFVRGPCLAIFLDFSAFTTLVFVRENDSCGRAS